MKRIASLILKGLWLHRRGHFGAFIGSMVAAAVLTGSLIVGDSVRSSLRKFSSYRLGKIQVALFTEDSLFRHSLAMELQNQVQGAFAAAIMVPGVALTPDGGGRANRVQVIGIDSAFCQMSTSGTDFIKNAMEDGVWINTSLAKQLGASQGTQIVIRVHKPSALSKDAPISKIEDSNVALRLKVIGILDDADFGRFSLHASQSPPFNAFVPLATLQKKLDQIDRANLIVGHLPELSPDRVGNRDQRAQEALTKLWKLEDVGLWLRSIDQESHDLLSSSVFLKESLVNRLSSQPPSEAGVGKPILTYFVNSINFKERSTPYSMVAALTAEVSRIPLRSREVILSAWCAQDLGATVGDSVELRYFVVGPGRALVEQSATFQVNQILADDSPVWAPTLTPEFPGLTDADNCREWDTGFPVDQDRIRPKDEEYWNQRRGTPKALISYEDGVQIWNNRFGTATAIRFSGVSKSSLGAAIHSQFVPLDFGVRFLDLEHAAKMAISGSQDFSGLFIGFSFFLICSALSLTSLLFRFGLDPRAAEVGTYVAVGFTPNEIRRLFLLESGLVVGVAGLFGVLGGALYAGAMILGLNSIWQDAVGTNQLQLFLNPVPLFLGWALSLIIVVLTIYRGVVSFCKESATTLLAGTNEMVQLRMANASTSITPKRRSILLAIPLWVWLCFAFSVACWILGFRSASNSAVAFFGSGAAALIVMIGLINTWIRSHTLDSTSTSTLSNRRWPLLKEFVRKPKRSLATVLVMGIGAFLVLGIGVFRLSSQADAKERSSGTGGFSLYGETTTPVLHDLNSVAGSEFYGFGALTNAPYSFLQFRLKDGEDASCLNLNRAQNPRILGVDARKLKTRGSFNFAGVSKGLDHDSGWELLNDPVETQNLNGNPTKIIPAVADYATIKWALGKSLGDVIPLVDASGQKIQLKLIAAISNSLLQGNLIISEDNFTKLFPNDEGYRVFLVDAPKGGEQQIQEKLTKALMDVGGEFQGAVTKLDGFNAVQNTYLGTFQILGGLGMMLATVGIGALLLRDTSERRSEFAILRVMGYAPKELVAKCGAQYSLLLIVGIFIGLVSALLAITPELLNSRHGHILPISWFLSLFGIVANGLFWIWTVSWFAVKQDVFNSLRMDQY